jgi:hypothetical protein
MTATTTRRRGGRRSNRYSPEEIAERKAADDRHRAKADEQLASEAAVTRLVDSLITSGLGPNMLGYSLRNQMLILGQAADRGIPVSEVYAFGGWRERGRGPRADEHGLRICAFNGADDDTADSGDDAPAEGLPADTAPGGGEGTGDGEAQRVSRRFRMISVFDRSQTQGADDEHVPVSDAAQLLLGNLTKQLGKRGYQVVVVAEDAPATVSNLDMAARTVTVREGWPGRDRVLTVALAMAQILTAPRPERGQR